MRHYAVVGLGYVGLNLVAALGKQFNQVYGYDINPQRIQALSVFDDANHQVSSADLNSALVHFTDDIADLKIVDFYIICVPTPAYYFETPDLESLTSAMETLGKVLKKKDIVVFESTVYPGTTEDICVPILERHSHLVCGQDFNVGYSPERINPGDKTHTLKNTTKIIAAQNQNTLEIIRRTYEKICDKVHAVSSIRVAEAIKILENTQRDANIAVMNEFSKICHSLQLDTHEIIQGAKTKWNFLPFKPGFVGGHCISIDSQYLAFIAKRHSVYPDLILAARKTNDGMTLFVIQSMLQLLSQHKFNLAQTKIGILGISYKENVNDIRNSLTLKLIKELKPYQFSLYVHDPLNYDYINIEQKLHLEKFDDLGDLDVLIIANAHDYYRTIGYKKILKKCAKPSIIMDIAHLFVDEPRKDKNIIYWSL